MRIAITICYIIFILLGVGFAALNATAVQVNLYVTKLVMPISVLMTAMLGIGLFLGFLMFLYRYWCLKAEHRRLCNQLKLTELEIKNLRSIPLQDQH